jgi:hypothetical protein
MDSSNIAPKKRLEIYKNFKNMFNKKMSVVWMIFVFPNSEFQLQAQQNFI